MAGSAALRSIPSAKWGWLLSASRLPAQWIVLAVWAALLTALSGHSERLWRRLVAGTEAGPDSGVLRVFECYGNRRERSRRLLCLADKLANRYHALFWDLPVAVVE